MLTYKQGDGKMPMIKTKTPGVYKYVREKDNKAKPDECYYIKYKLGSKQKTEKVGWKSDGYTVAFAKEVRNERLQQYRHGEFIEQATTIDDLWPNVRRWMENNRKSAKDPIRQYNMYIQPRFGHRVVKDITKGELNEFMLSIKELGRSEQTILHIMNTFRRIIKLSIEMDWYAGKNPFDGFSHHFPKPDNQRVRFLTHAEVEQLLDRLIEIDDDAYDLACIGLWTGMRLGEIYKLRWQHINFDGGVIRIPDRKNKQTGTAYITDAVQAILDRRKGYEDYLFPRYKGAGNKPPRLFTKTVDELFNKGITDPRHKVTFHCLRHSFASHLAMKGWPLSIIRDLLGHKSITMTERYSHLMPDQKRDAVKSLDGVFDTSSRDNYRANLRLLPNDNE